METENESATDVEYTPQRIDPAAKAEYKSNELLAVLARFNLTLPRNAIEWRVPPEGPVRGYIQGITVGSISMLCTDGIVAWFAWDDGTVLFGHVQHWKPERPKSFVGFGKKATVARPPSKRKLKIESLQDQD